MKRLPMIASFLLFIALCASIAYWALQLFKPPLRPVAAPPRVARVEVSPDAAAVLFGGRPGKVAVASNYQLKGVIMSGTADDSVAILSADGKPAQAVRVDMEIAPEVTVKEVHRDYVLLSEGGAIKRVDLPENAKAQVNLVPVPGPPIPSAGPVAPPPTTGRGQSMPPPSAAAHPPQTINPATPSPQPTARSPLLPPPAPQALQQPQGQTPPQGQPSAQQGQASAQNGQTAPPTVVVSPPPSSQSSQANVRAQPTTPPATANVAPQTPVATAAQPAANPSANPATVTPSGAAQYSGNSGAGSFSGGGGGEMLPPSTLQSR